VGDTGFANVTKSVASSFINSESILTSGSQGRSPSRNIRLIHGNFALGFEYLLYTVQNSTNEREIYAPRLTSFLFVLVKLQVDPSR
jgi:hypothetical protein